MKNIALVLSGCMALSACEVPVMVAAANNDAQLTGLTSVTFPAKMLLAVDGLPETLYSGEMIGYMSGAAKIALAAPNGATCQGEMAANGSGTIVCDGATFAMARRSDEKASMSGTIYREGIARGRSYASAFGWGKGADNGVLRQTLSQQRSFTAKETRQAAK